MINNINFIFFIALICTVIECKIDSKRKNSIAKSDDLNLSVYNLTSDEKRKLEVSNCSNFPVSLYKKINLTNLKYDTLWIAVTDYCELQKPFLLYDMALYFNNDTLVSRDFINTSSGHEIPLLNSGSISLYLRLKDDRYKQEIKFEARANVLGKMTFKNYVFKVEKDSYNSE
jgi:hypothetical protein